MTARARALPLSGALGAIALCAACPGPGAGPAAGPDRSGAGGGAAAGHAPAGSGAPAGAGSAEPSPEAAQEARLAAIQLAMNELDEGAQGCWAASAVERFDIEGELAATIEIERAAARVTFARDTTRTPSLAACVGTLLSAYRWAPPLHGQTIRLPFRFRAPDGQNVIDRRLVPWKGQGPVAVAVLLDEASSGNAAASMLELAVAAGGATGARIAERAELWYFLAPGAVETAGPASRRAVAAGDMMYVPARGARDVLAPGADLHALVVIAPGGREGAARAGALPTPEATPGAREPRPAVVHLPASAARVYPRPAGQVTLRAEPATIRDQGLAATVLELPGGAAIPEHAHAGETELLYLLAGSGTMTVKGVELAVTASSVVQIPPNTPHAFTATADVRAIQIYTPAGPEQRFKAAAPGKPPAPTKAPAPTR